VNTRTVLKLLSIRCILTALNIASLATTKVVGFPFMISSAKLGPDRNANG
jgi:hypothetical protein